MGLVDNRVGVPAAAVPPTHSVTRSVCLQMDPADGTVPGLLVLCCWVCLHAHRKSAPTPDAHSLTHTHALASKVTLPSRENKQTSMATRFFSRTTNQAVAGNTSDAVSSIKQRWLVWPTSKKPTHIPHLHTHCHVHTTYSRRSGPNRCLPCFTTCVSTDTHTVCDCDKRE